MARPPPLACAAFAALLALLGAAMTVAIVGERPGCGCHPLPASASASLDCCGWLIICAGSEAPRQQGWR